MALTELKKVRESLGLSQAEAAVALGTTQATISRLETGVHKAHGMALITIENWIKANSPNRTNDAASGTNITAPSCPSGTGESPNASN